MTIKQNFLIYEDDYLIVAHKPAGVDSQPSRGFSQDMVSMLKNELVRKGERDPYIGVVHRLDKPVEGLLVFARTPEMTAALCGQIAERNVHKQYCAVVRGAAPQEETELRDWLAADRASRNAVIVPEAEARSRKGTKLARLSFVNVGSDTALGYRPFAKRLECCGYAFDETAGAYLLPMAGRCADGTGTAAYSMVRIQLFTGRYHQIRAQLSHAGYPVAGDRRYAGEAVGMFDFPALCAVALEFTHPVTGERLRFSL